MRSRFRLNCAARVSLVHYNTLEEIHRFWEALCEMAENE
jgi:selenocysteine lyase/cysteine desulfurase